MAFSSIQSTRVLDGCRAAMFTSALTQVAKAKTESSRETALNTSLLPKVMGALTRSSVFSVVTYFLAGRLDGHLPGCEVTGSLSLAGRTVLQTLNIRKEPSPVINNAGRIHSIHHEKQYEKNFIF